MPVTVQKLCQPLGKSALRCGGFSLLELLVVICVLSILAGLTSPVVLKAREKARQADCKSNLRQFGTALVVFRADNDGKNPGWMSNLYPDYIDDKSLYVCKSDDNRGLGRTRPASLPEEINGTQDFEETIDNKSNPGRFSTNPKANADVIANSYFYEFSAAACTFGAPSSWAGKVTLASPYSWDDWKTAQLQHGDVASDDQPYSTSRMPIIRCYHHADNGSIPGYSNTTDGRIGSYSPSLPMTINVAYAGNVFVAPLWWEGRMEPGDTHN